MTDKIRKFMEQNNMLDGCENIVVGLSGGADSVCLINVLKEIIGDDIKITAVHINHGIRGDEALRDERFAKAAALALGVECHTYRLDIPSEARQAGVSEETAGRLARYRCFREVSEQLGAQHTRIAVAHHMDDQTETILMHMIRGSGVKGLAGMSPVSGNIIRPLLCVSRSEIEKYLEQRNISYVVDSTNCDNSYTRNMIRNSLIPEIKKMNSRFNNSVNAMAADVADYVEYIERKTDEAEARYMVYEGGFGSTGEKSGRALIRSEVMTDGCDRLIVTNLIKRAYAAVHGDIINLYRVHIEDTFRLLAADCGKQINLPAGVVARRCADGVELYNEKLNHDLIKDKDTVNPCSTRVLKDSDEPVGVFELPHAAYGGVVRLEWEVLPRVAVMNNISINNTNNDYTKFFDYDIIRGRLAIRNREEGDSCVIDRQGHTKKLKRELIDRKIDADLRDSVLLLAVDSDVLWAVGVRRYESCLVTETTENVLRVSAYTDEDIHGRRTT